MVAKSTRLTRKIEFLDDYACLCGVHCSHIRIDRFDDCFMDGNGRVLMKIERCYQKNGYPIDLMSEYCRWVNAVRIHAGNGGHGKLSHFQNSTKIKYIEKLNIEVLQ
jgi:hypothetical protein